MLLLDDTGKKNEVFSVGKPRFLRSFLPFPQSSSPLPFEDAGVACLLWSGGSSSSSSRKAATAPFRLICVGKNMSLAVFNVSPDGRMSPITQGMRLGANLRSGDLLSAFIVGASRLVVASGEPMLRVFNVGVDDGENYVRVQMVSAMYNCNSFAQVLSIAEHDDAVGEQVCHVVLQPKFSLIISSQGSPKEVIHSASLNPRTSVIAAVTGHRSLFF